MTLKLTKKHLSYYSFAFMTASLLLTQKSDVLASNIYFSEDFESNYDQWEIQRGSFNIILDETNTIGHTSTNSEGRIMRGDLSWTDYSISADMKVLDFNGSNRAFLCGRYTDGNNFYGVSLSSKNGLELRKKVNGASSVIAQVSTEIQQNTWYNVTLEMQGSILKVYLNGKLMIEATDDSLTAGAVGLVASKVQVNYDNILVTDVDNTVTPDSTPNPDPCPMP